MDYERSWLGRPREYYEELHQQLVAKALDWRETGELTTVVKIPEKSLEEHFEKNWGSDADNYRGEIKNWRGYGELKNLTVIKTESGQKTYLLDTSDLVIGKPEDCFFFHMMGTCWAVNADIKTPSGEILRMGYHLPGTTENKNFSISALFEELVLEGEVERLSVFYNGYQNVEKDIKAVKDALPAKLKTSFINIKTIFDWSAQDIYIQGENAEIYHNEGDYDHEKDISTVRRVFSGKCQAFEPNV